MSNNPLERDDFAVALMAKQINSGLQYVDKQTTSRPSKQPPAARLTPNKFLTKDGRVVENTERIQAPHDIKNILIPMPDNTTVNNQPSQTNNNQQLELAFETPTAKQQASIDTINSKIDDILNILANINKKLESYEQSK
jgi:hypothetical protein